MTLEEMIERLQPYAAAYHDGYLFESIIAALRRLERFERAGQKILSGMCVRPHPVSKQPIVFVHDEESVIDGVKAWDVAMGEKE